MSYEYKCSYCGCTDMKQHEKRCWYMQYAFKAPEVSRLMGYKKDEASS